MYVIKQLLSLKYQDASSMVNHINNFEGVINQLTAIALKFDDGIRGLFLLVSLLNSWETFRTSLCDYVTNSIISIELTKSSLLNEEIRRKSLRLSLQFKAFVTKSRGRSQTRNSQKGSRYGKSKGKSKSQKYIKCCRCNKLGHMRKECKSLKYKESKERVKIRKKKKILL